MPHTHHSHSGQFCNHAQDTLAEVLTEAVRKRMTTIGMTEHIPRSNKYLYPGELAAGDDHAAQEAKFEAYVAEAKRLRAFIEGDVNLSPTSISTALHEQQQQQQGYIRKEEGEKDQKDHAQSPQQQQQQGYIRKEEGEKDQKDHAQSPQQQQQYQANGPHESIQGAIPPTTATGTTQEWEIQVLIGLEGEWVDAEESPATIRRLMAKHSLDYFIGSIHHVRSIPIDFDRTHFDRAMTAVSGEHGVNNAKTAAGAAAGVGLAESQLFLAYFQEQAQMLQAMQPRVVGHFDVIRLLAAPAVTSWSEEHAGPVWDQILTNLRIVRAYGGVLEINTSALRKGLSEPYPRSEICRQWIDMGGDFVLSDDSHGVAQVGVCYPQALQFIKKIGLRRLAYLARRKDSGGLCLKYLSIDELESHPFYARSIA